jgi:AcrR family transcriptional regulator
MASSSRELSGDVPARGRADKYRAITRAARTVFGRDGYSRTSIDAIAAEAGVSSRTIYNHFDGKEQLFTAVLHASATQVADGFIVKVEDSHLTGTDTTGDLISLGYAFAAQRIDFPEHFAMVEQIIAEAPHFPPAIIDSWQEVGPRRVQREVARCLGQLADHGLLEISDPWRAAVHFMALTTAGMTTGRYGRVPLTRDMIMDIVRAGVDAFLNGYGVRAQPV